MNYRYVAFEGPIGAGKTTLARLYAQRFKADLLVEAFDINPFLPKYYANPDRWALATQLHFMASRREQFRAIQVPLVQNLVSDYSWLKDQVFANVTIRGEELELFKRISQDSWFPLIRPDMIVYIDAPNEILKCRIAKRGREYESSVTDEFISSIRRAYNKLIASSDVPVMRVDVAKLSINSISDLSELYSSISAFSLCQSNLEQA